MIILLFTKVYDTDVMTLKEIEKQIQDDLDLYLEKKPCGIQVSLSEQGKELTFRINRIYKDWNSTTSFEEHDVRVEDCQLLTGHGCLGFKLPYSWGGIPFLNAMEMIVCLKDDALARAYKNSSKALGCSVPIKLEATSFYDYFEAKLTFRGYIVKKKSTHTHVNNNVSAGQICK